jgi:hypothetical protein
MNQLEPPNPIAVFLADVWINAARHYGNPMTHEQEQLARQECARFSENQGLKVPSVPEFARSFAINRRKASVEIGE